jgi:hypothetical protein
MTASQTFEQADGRRSGDEEAGGKCDVENVEHGTLRNWDYQTMSRSC